MRARGWMWRVAVAVLLGALLGVVAVYRASPWFAPTERLVGDMVGAPNQESKDRLLLVAFYRAWSNGDAKEIEELTPVAMTVLIRTGRYDDFDRLWREAMDEGRRSTRLLQSFGSAIHLLMKRGDTARAERLWSDVAAKWAGDEAASVILRRTKTTIDAALYWRRVNDVIAALDKKLDENALAINDPAFDRLEQALAGPSPANELGDDQAVFFDTLAAGFTLFFGRAAGSVPGLLDRFGATYIKHVDRYQDFAATVSGLEASLHEFEKYPERWAEWRRFAERIRDDDFGGLVCVRDYLRGFFLAFAEHRVDAARRLYEQSVWGGENCGDYFTKDTHRLIEAAERGESPVPGATER